MRDINKNWSFVKEHIEQFPEYKSAIFEQGFLLTNTQCEFGDQFPFYGNWREVSLCESVHLYLHINQKAYVLNKNEVTYFLIGHAYDPFGYEAHENKLLEKLSDLCGGEFDKGIDYINDWTGLFVLGIIKGGNVTICGDYTSMRTAYYGVIEGRWYVTSHEELIALRENLTRDGHVSRFENYRWYHFYGEGLPGDIGHYHELNKLMSNTYVTYSCETFSLRRFYPKCEIKMIDTEEKYDNAVKHIAEIMKSTLELIAAKWNMPAISSTGGRDSKGTIAAAYHIKDKFLYYSYNSQLAEKVDCDAAKEICDAISVSHKTYDIPLEKSDYSEYDLVKAILHVNSNRVYFNHNDIMKRIFLRKTVPFDIELKSWVSEMGRAFYYVKYGVKRMQKKPSERRVNALNNIYLFRPALMLWADRIYADYMKRTSMQDQIFNYDWTDIAFCEFRYGRWGTEVISCEHMFSNDVTIPYNNRHLAEIMMSVPLKKRINSQTHIDFTKYLCPEIDKLNINIKDLNHDKKRMWLDKVYYFTTLIRPI